MKADLVLNAKGLACPMPIVKTKKAIHTLEPGQVLEVQATDQGAKNDLTAWCKSTGNELVDFTNQGDVLVFWIKKS
ncbi:hypothetical protein A374_04044 [Fictibacillus macauensis ZFHKF-1]|uniref:UPF0033 domain-containing protein n=1 Tax=Fictibacillus macauensis ZFHKF-1 TaxID=1196324 RepID=I8UIQ1_9BACL|nr:sulfurtransferase TusA family protein [Fictibacillus macauensis]EIT86713.1 hypothetical protein A374_04044 [Fictibacillus macauensis ZFHKF-1]